MYTIGRLARHARVNADSIRFYERQGLLSPSTKTASGYRLYGEDALRRLTFIRHAQRCGFNLAEVGELLKLNTHDESAQESSRALAVRKLADIRECQVALSRMEQALTRVMESPPDSRAPDAKHIPIIAALEESVGADVD